MGVSFETCLGRRGDVMMGRCCYVLLRRPYDVPIRRRGDAPLTRLGDVPSRRRWVFYLRLVETSWRRNDGASLLRPFETSL